jgi:hypothetical protein
MFKILVQNLKYFRMNFILHLYISIKLSTLKIQNLFGGRTKNSEGRMRPAGSGPCSRASNYSLIPRCSTHLDKGRVTLMTRKFPVPY